MNRTLALLGTCVVSLAILTSPAQAVGVTACNGVSETPIDGPVSVASGAYCALTDRDHATTVTVAPGGYLAANDTTMTSVIARDGVKISDSVITGPLVLSGIKDSFSVVCGSTLGGDVTIVGSSTAVLLSTVICKTGDTFRRNLTVVDSGPSAYILIDASSIAGNLTCTGNSLVPTVTNTTTVQGRRIGQCAGQ